MSIRIIALTDGFRRAGIAHPALPAEYNEARFDKAQLAQLVAEPELVVWRVGKDGKTELLSHYTGAEATADRLGKTETVATSEPAPAAAEITALQERLAEVEAERDQWKAAHDTLAEQLAAIAPPVTGETTATPATESGKKK